MQVSDIISCHINRSWDGHDQRSLVSHDMNLVIGKKLRINPMWRDYEDAPTAHLFIGWISKDWTHHELLSVELYPHCSIRAPWLRRAVKRVVNFWAIRKLERQLAELEEHAEAVCNDPMSGYVGYFCDDFERQAQKLEAELTRLKN